MVLKFVKSSLTLSLHEDGPKRQSPVSQGESSAETTTAGTLILNLPAPELRENCFLLFKPPQSVIRYYDSLSTPTHLLSLLCVCSVMFNSLRPRRL